MFGFSEQFYSLCLFARTILFTTQTGRTGRYTLRDKALHLGPTISITLPNKNIHHSRKGVHFAKVSP
jgi:hypothetical protein